jgi:dihydroorotase
VFYGATTGHLVFSRLDRLSRALERVGSSPLVVFHAEDQAIMDAAEARYQAEWERARCCPVGSDAWLESFALHSLRRPPEAAVKAVEEILRWARGWGGRVHIAHVSTAREVELIGEARTLGVRVTCEVAPHHLLLSMEDSPRLGAFLKVNPPVRDRAERERLRRLVGEGVVDAFATDHAPHTREEKSQDLARVPSGIPSLELFWPLVTECARVSGLPWERAVAMASEVPARILGLTRRGLLEVGARADFVRFRREAFRVTQKEIVSSCGYSPYDGMELPGKVREVWIEGRSVSREMARD